MSKQRPKYQTLSKVLPGARIEFPEPTKRLSINIGDYKFMTNFSALMTETAPTRLASAASHTATMDAGKIRLGGCAPVLATQDTGRVRLGGCAPVLSV